MTQDIEIPDILPVMTLNSTVLFPHVIMPLFIFESRYKKMLRDILEQDRIFAVAMLDDRSEQTHAAEMPYYTAGVGVIRACKKNSDGNSNLVLQGIARVQFESIISESPYRTASIKRINSRLGDTEDHIQKVRDHVIGLIQTKCRLQECVPPEVVRYITGIQDPEELLDISIHTLCTSAHFKQELLETNNLTVRFNKFTKFLEADIKQLKLNLKLRGNLDDKNVGDN